VAFTLCVEQVGEGDHLLLEGGQPVAGGHPAADVPQPQEGQPANHRRRGQAGETEGQRAGAADAGGDAIPDRPLRRGHQLRQAVGVAHVLSAGYEHPLNHVPLEIVEIEASLGQQRRRHVHGE